MRRFIKGLRAAAAPLVISLFVSAALLAAGAYGKRAEPQETKGGKAMQLRIPQSITAEHAELHEELTAATKAGGDTGRAARAVAELLHPHFVKEEEYALPPLGALAALAEGREAPGEGEIISMAARLKAELPRMLDEHREIVAALDKLSAAAESEGRREYVLFAGKLLAHARQEEEILYPAAILVGEYLSLRARR